MKLRWRVTQHEPYGVDTRALAVPNRPFRGWITWHIGSINNPSFKKNTRLYAKSSLWNVSGYLKKVTKNRLAFVPRWFWNYVKIPEICLQYLRGRCGITQLEHFIWGYTEGNFIVDVTLMRESYEIHNYGNPIIMSYWLSSKSFRSGIWVRFWYTFWKCWVDFAPLVVPGIP